QLAVMESYHQRLDIHTYADKPAEKHLYVRAAFLNGPLGIGSQNSNLHYRVGFPWIDVDAKGSGGGCWTFPILAGNVEGAGAHGPNENTACGSFDYPDIDAMREFYDASFPVDFPLKPV